MMQWMEDNKVLGETLQNIPRRVGVVLGERVIGNFLRKCKDQVFGSLKIRKFSDAKKSNLWTIVSITDRKAPAA